MSEKFGSSYQDELKARVEELTEEISLLRDENECLREELDGYRLDRGCWSGGRHGRTSQK